MIQHAGDLNTSLDVLQNTFVSSIQIFGLSIYIFNIYFHFYNLKNFSNSSSWNANDDDLDDFDTDLNLKPVQSNSGGNGQKRHLNS